MQIGESCDPKIRGILGSLPSIFMSLAILMAYIIGSLVKWDILAWYCSVMTAFFGLVLFMMPESPVWLRSKKRFKEAEESCAWLRLPSPPASTVAANNEKMELEMAQLSNSNNDANQSKRSIYLTRPIVMPLIIGLSLLVLQQISGIDAIIFFTVEIFRASGKFQFLDKRMVDNVDVNTPILCLFLCEIWYHLILFPKFFSI